MSRASASSRPVAVAAILAATLSLGSLPATADTVYLKHGGTFENVLVTATGDRYRIQMEGGEMHLAKSQVERVEQSPTPFGEVLARKAELARERNVAPEWLALARYALDHGLKHSARESALVAAELDPGLAGLGDVLHRFGYEQDARTGTWLSHEETMSRRGLVQEGNEWVTQAEQRQRWDEQREQDLARRRAALEEIRLRRELEEASRPAEPARRETAPSVVVVPIVASFPLPFVVIPNLNPTPGPAPLPGPVATPTAQAEQHPGPVMDMLERQPGSLIPGVLKLGPP